MARQRGGDPIPVPPEQSVASPPLAPSAEAVDCQLPQVQRQLLVAKLVVLSNATHLKNTRDQKDEEEKELVPEDPALTAALQLPRQKIIRVRILLKILMQYWMINLSAFSC
jgi:hypothetical protein